MIVGQKNLLNQIEILSSRFPRFVILSGDKGCGKKTICNHIATVLNASINYCDIGIASVRQIIDMSYEQVQPIIYVFADADSMSISAKNALLKVTEEPPRQAYFIITLRSLENTLETLKSRGTVLRLDTYSKQDLQDYIRYKNYDFGTNIDTVLQICESVSDIDYINTIEINKFYTFCSLVCDKINIPKNGNAFKITKNLLLKEPENGYDAILTFRLISHLFFNKFVQTKKVEYHDAVLCTLECLNQLNLTSVSKLGTVDNWILEVRKALKDVS